MNQNQIWTCLVGLILISPAALAQQRSESIRFSRDKDVLFLNAADLAKSLELELKIVDPQGLVTFCRDKDGGFCIPVRLGADNHRHDGEQLLIAADVVRKALRFKVVEVGERITIVANPQSPVSDERIGAPGYNAPWEAGRGFAKGYTLPDIPLVDVTGNEVRFSQFLGNRYILYCWASW